MKQIRSLKRQAGFWNFIIPAIASIGAAAMGKDGQEDANESNAAIARETREWNSMEAEKARAFNSAQASLQREFSAGQVDDAMSFAERMASTSYQRAVGDMRAAGLNPMLAYSQGGAPSPSGHVGSSGAASGPAASMGSLPRMENTATAGLQSGFQAFQLQNMVKQGANIDADTALKEAAATKELASAGQLKASEDKIREEIPGVKWQIEKTKVETGSLLVKQTLDSVLTALYRVEANLKGEQINAVQANTQLTKIRTLLGQLALPQARNAANAEDTWWKENVTPFLRDIFGGKGVMGLSDLKD